MGFILIGFVMIVSLVGIILVLLAVIGGASKSDVRDNETLIKPKYKSKK